MATLSSYYYTIDHNGFLFLSPCRIRNFTSAYKDVAFLDFFNQRIRRLVIDESSTTEAIQAKTEGYNWVSPCGREMNYIATDLTVTPVVYQNLSKDRLSWAGSFSTEFDPSSLRLGLENGYLYHRSPLLSTRRDPSPASSPFGKYSLLRSSLVLEAFSQSLHMNDDGSGGTFEWHGKKWEIRPIGPGDLE